MTTEEEIKEMAINTFAQTVECGAMCEECCSTLGNSPGGKVLCQMSDKPLEEDDYCPQQVMVIENFAHELYTKLFTAPSDLREKLSNYHRGSCRDCDLAKPWTMACGYEHRTASFCPKDIKAIHSLYIQAGFKSPEERDKLRKHDFDVSVQTLEKVYKAHEEQVEQAKKEEREKIARVLNEGLESTRKPSQWQGTVVDYEQWGKDCVYFIMLKLEQGQALKKE